MIKKIERIYNHQFDIKLNGKEIIGKRQEKIPIVLLFKNNELEAEYILHSTKGIRLPFAMALACAIFFQFIFTDISTWILSCCTVLCFIVVVISPMVLFKKYEVKMWFLYELICFIQNLVCLQAVLFISCFHDELNGIMLYQFGFTIFLRVRFVYVLFGELFTLIIHVIMRMIVGTVLVPKFYKDAESVYFIIVYLFYNVLLVVTMYILEILQRKTFVQTKVLHWKQCELRKQTKLLEILLYNIVPKDFVSFVKDSTTSLIVLEKKNCIVVQTDLVDFTQFCENNNSSHVFEMLNHHYMHFDILCRALHHEKLMTIGDSFLAIAYEQGSTDKLDENVEHDFDFNCYPSVVFALGTIYNVDNVNKEMNINLNIRVGIGAGSIRMAYYRNNFSFDIFGEAYEEAKMKEENATTNHINVSEWVYNQTKTDFEYKVSVEQNSVNELTGKKYEINGQGECITQKSINQVIKKFIEEHSSLSVEFDKELRKKVFQFLGYTPEIRNKKKKEKKNGNYESSAEELSDFSDGVLDNYRKGSLNSNSINTIGSASLISSLTNVSENEKVTLKDKIVKNLLFERETGLYVFLFCYLPFGVELEYQKKNAFQSIIWNLIAIVLSFTFSLSHLILIVSQFIWEELYSTFAIVLYSSMAILAFLFVVEVVNLRFMKSLPVSIVVSFICLGVYMLVVLFYRHLPDYRFFMQIFKPLGLLGIGQTLSISLLFFFNVYVKIAAGFIYSAFHIYTSLRLFPSMADGIYIDQTLMFITLTTFSIIYEIINRNLHSKIIEGSNTVDKIDTEKTKHATVVSQILTQDLVERIKQEEIIFDEVDNAFIGFISLFEKDGEKIAYSKMGIKSILEVFCEFDEILRKTTNTKRVKTINHTYFFIVKSTKKSQENFYRIIEAIRLFNKRKRNFMMKVGLTHGSISAGIVGYEKLLYDAVGNNVNVSSRLCQTSQMTESDVHCVKGNLEEFMAEGDFEFHGEKKTFLKGKGEVITHYIKIPMFQRKKHF